MEGWEEGIDVDDSDLHSVLHPLASLPSANNYSNPNPNPNPTTLPLSLPPLQPCSQFPRPSQSLPSNPPTEPRLRSPSPSPEKEEEAAAAGTTALLRRRIPGPAGAIQAAMHRQVAAVPDRGKSRLVEEGADRGAFGNDGDEDFMLNPWLCALYFLGGEGRSARPSPISSVKTLGRTDRVLQVAGIVKSCKPNGLGDLFVTLKDPTGTIGASIHRKVLTEGNFCGDLSIGCVLILKQVAIFSPIRSTSYLNVMWNNVVKLISKDSGPPSRQMLPTFTARCAASGKHMEVGMGSVERAPLASQGAERIAEVESRKGSVVVVVGEAEQAHTGTQESVRIANVEVMRNVNCKSTMDDGENFLLGSLSYSGAAATTSVGLGTAKRTTSLSRQGTTESFGGEQGIQNGNCKRRMDDRESEAPTRKLWHSTSDTAAATCPGWGSAQNAPLAGLGAEQIADEVEVIRSKNCKVMMDHRKREGATGSLPYGFSSTATATTVLNEPVDKMIEPKKLISKVSVAQWTDEQLSELFSDYQDDADLFNYSI